MLEEVSFGGLSRFNALYYGSRSKTEDGAARRITGGRGGMKLYRPLSLMLMLLFAATGLIFLFFPDSVLRLFNTLSAPWGWTPAPAAGFSFYLILATGYMYLVTILAFLMFRHPENRYFPLLLINAKLASSVLSLALFLLQAHYLVYLANFAVDGVIGAVVLALYLKAGRVAWASP